MRSCGRRPAHPLALFNLGITLIELQRLDEAVRWLRAALREAPSRADTHFYLGRALGRQRRLPDARASLGKALELDPRHAAAYRELALVYLAQGERRLALEALVKASKVDQPATPATPGQRSPAP